MSSRSLNPGSLVLSELILAALLLVAPTPAIAAPQTQPTKAILPEPRVLDDGHAVRAVRAIQPFSLSRSYNYEWSSERAPVTEGLLLVLDVDPAFLIPSDTRQAVLYCGDLPVERLNTGWPDGRLVVLVPGQVDLARNPLYFGGYELPEAVSRTDGQARLEIALRNGIRPLPVPAPSPPMALSGRDALGPVIAALEAQRGP